MDLVCKDIVIDLENSRENHFMDEADVLRLVEGSGQSIKGTSLDHIDLRSIEKNLNTTNTFWMLTCMAI
jgi:hypothetical protein